MNCAKRLWPSRNFSLPPLFLEVAQDLPYLYTFKWRWILTRSVCDADHERIFANVKMLKLCRMKDISSTSFYGLTAVRGIMQRLVIFLASDSYVFPMQDTGGLHEFMKTWLNNWGECSILTPTFIFSPCVHPTSSGLLTDLFILPQIICALKDFYSVNSPKTDL